jgi:hypothetical protein
VGPILVAFWALEGYKLDMRSISNEIEKFTASVMQENTGFAAMRHASSNQHVEEKNENKL